MKKMSHLTATLLALATAWPALAAPHTLKGGSDYEQNLQQAGMSGMSGMSGNSGTTSGGPAKAAKAAKAGKATGSAKAKPVANKKPAK